MFPIPILLNNPGALEHTSDNWEGATRLQDNKRFVRFKTPQDGLRAMMRVLKTYEEVHGYQTLGSMIYHYAPPAENNTDLYLSDVCRRTGFPSNVLIDIHNIDVLIKIAKAITIHESGHPPIDSGIPLNWYPEAVFHEAAVAALSGE